MPGDNRVEAVVRPGARIDGVQADSVPELPQPADCGSPFDRREVVEDGLGHQEVCRLRFQIRLDLGHAECRSE